MVPGEMVDAWGGRSGDRGVRLSLLVFESLGMCYSLYLGPLVRDWEY